jgi:hypothetical protein
VNGPVFTPADAGLFVLMATLNVPVITLTAEWSTPFGVQLMEARKESSSINSNLDFEITNDTTHLELIAHFNNLKTYGA